MAEPIVVIPPDDPGPVQETPDNEVAEAQADRAHESAERADSAAERADDVSRETEAVAEEADESADKSVAAAEVSTQAAEVSVGALAALDERLQGMENKIAEILANAGHSSPAPEVPGPPEDITEEPPAPEPIPEDDEPEQTHWFYRRIGGRR